ncbi:sulfurtransferase [Sphingobacterium suaedae]|uniref:Sulfurtransferase n=1 Tax=Sphingobacterium suaedae TaxID=1686402 RepID=A0ABW5KGJ3_9SPHI
MKSIISAQQLLTLRGQNALTLIDATSGPTGRDKYKLEHLTGAIHIDLEQDLSAIYDAKVGGRHPLPSPAQFSGVLGRLGITEESLVVIYDRAAGTNAAARFWWMLRSAGHQATYVLDGGFQAGKRAGFSIAKGFEVPKSVVPYYFSEWQLPLISMQQVEGLIEDPDSLIIDVREAYRYLGESEPIDLQAGHVPTAVNIPLANNLEQNGLFKSPTALRAFYQPILCNRERQKIAVYCGSGVTACHTLLALDYAG